MLHQDIRIVAIEGDHVFGPSEADKMRLPFNIGWESWAVIHGNDVVVVSQHFEVVHETYRALANMETFYETQH